MEEVKQMTFENIKITELDFPNRLKLLRESKSISQQMLADYIGVTRPTISGYETKGYHPGKEKLTKIAERLDVSIDYLLHGGTFDVELVFYQKYGTKQFQKDFLAQFSTLSYKDRSRAMDYVHYLSEKS